MSLTEERVWDIRKQHLDWRDLWVAQAMPSTARSSQEIVELCDAWLELHGKEKGK